MPTLISAGRQFWKMCHRAEIATDEGINPLKGRVLERGGYKGPGDQMLEDDELE